MNLRKKSIWLFFEAHREDGRVWGIRYGREWFAVKRVCIHGQMVTRYRGRSSPMPKAFLYGLGRIVFGADGEATLYLTDD